VGNYTREMTQFLQCTNEEKIQKGIIPDEKKAQRISI
jgi:hypothetical protein